MFSYLFSAFSAKIKVWYLLSSVLKAGAGLIEAGLFQADLWILAGITRVHSDLCHGSSRHFSAVEFGPHPFPSGHGNHMINSNVK